MQKLNKILEGIDTREILGNHGVNISGLELDSRNVVNGSMFFALKGITSDGHDFIEAAVIAGAAAVVCESLPAERSDDVTYVVVNDCARVLGLVASAFYGHPSRSVKLTGITGTNGKTTTATLLYRLFKEAGYSSGLISTVGYFVNDLKIKATHTTPDPITLNRLLHEMVVDGCEYCFMEVSSHAIVQQRIGGLAFAGGVFTNLSHDHLDYHVTFDEYLRAKKLFFDKLGKHAFALVNRDDRNSPVMVQNTGARIKSFAIKSMAEYMAAIVERHPDGMLLNINGREVWTGFIGNFNAYNILAVFATASLLGLSEDESLKIISSLTPVEGRFETIRSEDGVTAIVDYAHTPDALENVLEAITPLLKTAGQLFTITGAGGDRDKSKRPVMARIAFEKSDKLILTADNPRSEDPEEIISEMLEGIDNSLTDRVLCISNRKEAIRTACIMAKPGDFVLVAGKGHETYQEIKGVRHHFDDREIVRSVFNARQKI